MLIALQKLDDSPFRDFKLYPIDEKQVSALTASMRDLGAWGGVIARPHPTKPDRYQIAAGHHRVRAARQVRGLSVIECTVDLFDDDKMIRILAAENATQKGKNTGAMLDSVAAAMRRMAYLLLNAGPTLSTIVESMPSVFESAHAAETARRMLLSGKGLGEPAIRAYLGTDVAPSRREIEESVATLKQTGTLKRILGEVQERIEEENAERERDEAKQRRVAEKAEREAEEARATAEKAEARAKEAHEKAAEIRAAKEREKAERAQSEARKISKEMDARRDSREAVRKSASAAVDKAPTATMSDKVASIFENESQLRAFREVVGSDQGRMFIPIEQHEALAKAALEAATKGGHGNASAKGIKDFLNAKMREAIVIQKRITERERERQLLIAQHDRLKLEYGRFESALGSVSASAVRIDEMQKGWPKDEPMPFSPTLLQRVGDTIKALETLRTRLKTRAH